MNAPRCARAALSLVLFLAAPPAFAQTDAIAQSESRPKPFQPTVGQAGKDVVWVPTQSNLMEKMLDVANVTADDFVIDLGSGDGRTVIAAARRGARAMGVEYNPDMVELSRKNAAAAGVAANTTFVQADLFKTDFSRATVLTLFLLEQINMQLRPQILEMAPGTRVVSNTWGMEDWNPDQTVSVPDCEDFCGAYFWIVPAKVEGTWQTPRGALTIKQGFQFLTGTLGKDEIKGRMRGSEISFKAGNTTYSGRVEAGTMHGTTSDGATWSASRQ
jgi:phospholipid N-methyltransferase